MAWFVVTGDATADGIRVVRSVLGAVSSLPMVATFQTPWRRTQTKQTLDLEPKTLNQVLNRIVDVSSAQATSTLTISAAGPGGSGKVPQRPPAPRIQSI